MESSMRESDWVSERWKQAIERVREVGARQASQGRKKAGNKRGTE